MQTELETTLSQLVSIPSVSSNPAVCREIITFVQDQLAPHSLHMTSDLDTPHPWLIATTQPTKEPEILIAVHLDVVPAQTELFTLQKRNGKLYGRGVYDMKYAAACALELIRTHADELREKNIGFLFTTDEEVGGFSILSILELGWRPDVVFIPDGGENWKIEEKAKGFYDFEITARGRTAHGSRPWEGDNAVHTILDMLTILRQSYPSENPDGATLAVTSVHGGDAINQIPDLASTKIEFRTFDAHEIALYRAQVEQLAEKHNLELAMVIEGAPVTFDKTLPEAQHFLKTLEEQTGHPAQYIKSYGGSDARHFAKYDIPSIIISPTGGARHSPEEWMAAHDLAKFYELMRRWLLS